MQALTLSKRLSTSKPLFRISPNFIVQSSTTSSSSTTSPPPSSPITAADGGSSCHPLALLSLLRIPRSATQSLRIGVSGSDLRDANLAGGQVRAYEVQPHGAAGYATATTTGDSIQRSGLITLTIVRHVYRKERYSGLRSVGPKTKREQLLKATALVPLLLIFPNAYSMLAANLFVFWHISAGIEEILADYVHHEMTRNYVVIAFKLFLIIAMKDVFLKFVFV
ncbi:succinate dehydrogenase subunit 4, mitochondrial-like isoform X3 [Arachis ipaensis]|uniref:succinate dehydrogenase subunit 4, mitochondrial-like isoform X3 n=1 Tax=Arachis ipaensis TaxID=130454 RepID=UPI000A2B389C|nr:succinate dehydrogenase subunit 4, mitochondrial-like isoform X3 [Arachis ipaensis]